MSYPVRNGFIRLTEMPEFERASPTLQNWFDANAITEVTPCSTTWSHDEDWHREWTEIYLNGRFAARVLEDAETVIDRVAEARRGLAEKK